MDCPQARQAIGPYHDAQLDPAAAEAVRMHVAQCRTCDKLAQDHAELTAALRDGATYFTAPSALKARMMQKGHDAAMPWFKRAIGVPRWLAGAAVASTAVLSVAATLALMPHMISAALPREVASSHVRSLMADHLTDVPSSDQHTVKPWFAGKLNFAPPVVDLSRDGFELIGGRLDYVDGRSVAALVYQRRQHRINVFVWPSADAVHGTWSQNGFNLVAWSQAGMQMWAVSDLNAPELDELHRLLQANANRQ